MTLFYRVEDKNNRGPYRDIEYTITDYLYNSFPNHNDNDYCKNHPTPDYDPLLSKVWNSMNSDLDKKYVFGFKALDQVFNWFYLKEEQDYLKDFEFKISVYEVSEKDVDIYKNCYHGKWQSIARKDSLKLIESIEF